MSERPRREKARAGVSDAVNKLKASTPNGAWRGPNHPRPLVNFPSAAATAAPDLTDLTLPEPELPAAAASSSSSAYAMPFSIVAQHGMIQMLYNDLQQQVMAQAALAAGASSAIQPAPTGAYWAWPQKDELTLVQLKCNKENELYSRKPYSAGTEDITNSERTRNWDEVFAALQKTGSKATRPRMLSKWTELCAKYRKLKNAAAQTGAGAEQISWVHYEALDRLLGEQAAPVFEDCCLEEMGGSAASDDDEKLPETDSPVSDGPAASAAAASSARRGRKRRIGGAPALTRAEKRHKAQEERDDTRERALISTLTDAIASPAAIAPVVAAIADLTAVIRQLVPRAAAE